MILEILLFEFLVLSQIFNLLLYMKADMGERKVLRLALSVQLLQATAAATQIVWLAKQHANAIVLCGPILSGITNVLIVWTLKNKASVNNH